MLSVVDLQLILGGMGLAIIVGLSIGGYLVVKNIG